MHGKIRSLVATALCVVGCSAPTVQTSTLMDGHRATMTALGYQPHGEPARGRIPAAGTKRHRVRLSPGFCYRLVALAESDGLELDTALVSPAGQRTGGHNVGRESALRYCPNTEGDYQLSVTARTGSGSYLVSAWRDPDEHGTTSAENLQGSCEAPLPLTLGQTVQGSTDNARDHSSSTCLRGHGPDRIYSLELTARRRVTLTLRAEFDAALYLQRACGSIESEVSCCNLAVVHGTSRVDTVLDPGRYFVVVDGADTGRSGNFTLEAQSGEPTGSTEFCATARPVTPGTAVRGDTSGRPDLLHGTCSSGRFPGPENVWSLALAEPMRVRAEVTADGDWDTALYVRRTCDDPRSELACNDDAEDTQHARVSRVFPAGNYTLVVDGYVAGSQGAYGLQVDTSPVAGSGAPNDACANAQRIEASATTPGDTFSARDDLRGSCGGEGAPDVVYRLDVARRTHVTAELAPTGMAEVPRNTRVYFTRTCGNARAEVACGTGRADAVLTPGTWYVVVDGATNNDFGRFSLVTRTAEPAGIDAACRRPAVLVPGQVVSGVTSGTDRLGASCGNGARSAEQVYSLRLTERRHVTLEVRGRFDTVLSVRSACERQSTELACNDDYHGERTSHLELDLDAGTYFVIVDGFDQGSAGSYELQALLAPPRTPGPGPTVEGAAREETPAPQPGPDPGGTGNPCGGAR